MHEKDIQQLSPQQRYQHFISTTAETGELWTLIDSDGSFALFEVEHNTVISFWPKEHFIESNLTPDWLDYIPFKLDMETLQDIVIPLIRQNGYFINIFPVDSRTGHITALDNFITDLNRELQGY